MTPSDTIHPGGDADDPDDVQLPEALVVPAADRRHALSDEQPNGLAVGSDDAQDRFELIEHGDFWLSDKPDEAGSRGWDAALPRVATWAKFKDKAAGTQLLHVNTHFDHRGEKAREV